MSVTLAAVDNLFPLTLWKYHVSDEGLNEGLLSEIKKRRAAEKGIPNSNRRGWQSERDLFARAEQSHARLVKIITEVVVKTLHSLDPTMDRTALRVTMNGWVNINPPGGYNSPHQHTDALLSGVYYIAVPRGKSEAAGAIEFLSPHAVRQLGGLIKAPMFADRRRVHPEVGDLLLFPGQLPHWVHPNDSGKDRVTIAFNAIVSRRLPEA